VQLRRQDITVSADGLVIRIRTKTRGRTVAATEHRPGRDEVYDVISVWVADFLAPDTVTLWTIDNRESVSIFPELVATLVPREMVPAGLRLPASFPASWGALDRAQPPLGRGHRGAFHQSPASLRLRSWCLGQYGQCTALFGPFSRADASGPSLLRPLPQAQPCESTDGSAAIACGRVIL